MMRKITIDQFVWIRILACFCIIILHALFASNVYFETSMTSGEVLWSKIMQNELMWAVPCFLMITGALLLDRNRELPLKKLFGKYLRRIALALVCFTLIFQFLEYKMEGADTIWTGWLDSLLTGQSWAHMWYLYLMIGIYLMMPLYKMVADKADDKMLDYLILVLAVFTSLLPSIEAFGIIVGFYIPTTMVYPVYVFMGYRLYQRPLHPAVAAGLLAFCTLALLALTYARYGTDMLADIEANQDSQLSNLFGYASIFVVGQTAGLFSLLNRLQSPAGILATTIDDCTFGIYLIHMIGIHMIMKWWEFNPYWYGPFTFILMAAVLFLLSFGITWVIRRIPKLNLL